MSDASAQLLGVLIGWLLGVGSHFIIEEAKRRREEREVRAVLKVELSELQYRMAAVLFSCGGRIGKLNKATLELIRPIVVTYEGVNQSENFLVFIDELLSMPDEQLADEIEKDDRSFEPAIIPAMQKCAIPMLESKLGLLSSLGHDTALQARLLEIRSRLSMFNDAVDQAHFYYQLTLTTGTSTGTYERATRELNKCYESAINRARTIINHISKIKW
jgi:hypothetical protein